MSKTPWREIFRSAMFIALIFFFIQELIYTYIPIAIGKRLTIYESNKVIAFAEVLMIIMIIAFLIHEYVNIVRPSSHGAEAAKA